MIQILWDAAKAAWKLLEVYSNKILPQETRKISKKQSNLTPKGIRERRTNKTQSQQKERNHKYQSRNKWNRIGKINETKSWLFENISKIDKPLGRLNKKKRERAPINKIRNEKGEATTDTTEIQRIIRDYYEQLHANKTDNLEGIDEFLKRYNLPRLNQEDTENMNRPITRTEIESAI